LQEYSPLLLFPFVFASLLCREQNKNELFCSCLGFP